MQQRKNLAGLMLFALACQANADSHSIEVDTDGTDNVTIIGDNNRVLNSTEIGAVVFGSLVDLSNEDRATMERLVELLELLAGEGQLEITEEGARRLGAESGSFLAEPVFDQNIIDQTQVSLRRSEVYYVGQTGVSIMWRSGCATPGNIAVQVAGFQDECFPVGGSVTVEYAPQPFVVQYMGRDPENGSSRRMFAVFPVE